MKNNFERTIFEIPIYISDEKTFYNKREIHINKGFQRTLKFSMMKEEDILKSSKDQIREHYRKQYGSWKFGQIVGWVRLYILGNQVRGESWALDNKRIEHRTCKKNFIRMGKEFELTFHHNDNSKTIFEEILANLKNITSRQPYLRRYIDLEPFINLGSSINWIELIGNQYFLN